MRRSQLVVGRQYRLVRRGGGNRVTVLDTPEEVEARGLVRLRYDSGVKLGCVTEQQLRFVQPLNPTRHTTEVTESIIRREHEEPGNWPPEPGDRVHLPEVSGDLEWIVEAADLKTGKAKLVSEIFGTKQHREAHLRDVEPLPIKITRESRVGDQPDDETVDQTLVARPPTEEAIDDDRKPLDRIVDRLIFAEDCVRQYHRDYAKRVPWERAAGSLERCLRREGRVIRKYPSEYARIRTKHFDVQVMTRPSDEEPLMVSRLLPRGPAPRTRKRRKPPRR
jgi:hypothetical protein